MIRIVAFAFAGLTAFTSAEQVSHRHVSATPQTASAITLEDTDTEGMESLRVYYTPLDSTEVAKYVGLGKAYHMAIVYTDARGLSYGVSSGPSNLSAPQTPTGALSALVDAARDRPSRFGTLVSDPHNNMPFVMDGATDVYTRDASHRSYPHALVSRGRDLSATWAAIVRTYGMIGGMHLTYSPVSQNSNSMAGTALRRAGVELPFSSGSLFTPGRFTELPEG